MIHQSQENGWVKVAALVDTLLDRTWLRQRSGQNRYIA